jgi:hypothetical protein
VRIVALPVKEGRGGLNVLKASSSPKDPAASCDRETRQSRLLDMKGTLVLTVIVDHRKRDVMIDDSRKRRMHLDYLHMVFVQRSLNSFNIISVGRI